MTELTIQMAEQHAGKRLDRRYKWFLWDGEVCFNGTWTGPCSGCSCDTEYPCSCCTVKGAGCHECGFTGRRVHNFPCPHWTLDIEKEKRTGLKAYSFHDGEPPDDPPAGYQEYCEGVASVRDYAQRLRQQAVESESQQEENDD